MVFWYEKLPISYTTYVAILWVLHLAIYSLLSAILITTNEYLSSCTKNFSRLLHGLYPSYDTIHVALGIRISAMNSKKMNSAIGVSYEIFRTNYCFTQYISFSLSSFVLLALSITPSSFNYVFLTPYVITYVITIM